MTESLYDQFLRLTPVLKELAAAGNPTPATIRSCQRDVGDQLTRDLLTAAKLQAKAGEKFGTGTWWVTEKSLQQATPWQVAQAKSRWFSDQPVYDLCCGIGGDAIQFASRGPVIGVDSDERLAGMAAANLVGKADASIVCADVTVFALPSSPVIHVDPDRRRDGRRSSDPSFYSPPWQDVVRCVQNSAGVAVKLAPAAQPDLSQLPSSHRVWISLAGSVREQALLAGTVRERFCSVHHLGGDAPGSALIVDRNGDETLFAPIAHSRLAPDCCEAPSAFMVDPDAAIRAAGLTEAFAIEHRLSTLGGPAGFLTGVVATSLPNKLAISEPVLWRGSSDHRRLRRELRSRNAYPSRIKTRGANVDPAKLQKQLRDCGDQPVTLWIGRIDQGQYAAITQPTAAGARPIAN